ncbi:elongation factor G, partial [candidate division KSB1 bacterium 4484_188]
MKKYTGEHIRNIGLAAHGGAGKTSLVEAMLYTMGATTRMGKIDQGNTASDYNEDEIERQISINTSLLHGEWDKHKINIIDTPGYADFFGDVVSGLYVVENVFLLISASSGIEVGTEQAWTQAEKYRKPVSFVINKLDHENIDFDSSVQEIRDIFGKHAWLAQFPVEVGPNFFKIIDVLKMKMFVYPQDGSGKATVEAIPGDLQAKAEDLRNKLTEAVAESDDELLEKYFEAGELSEVEFAAGFKKAFMNRQIFPVFCTAATRNVGVSRLLNFTTEMVPSPVEIPPTYNSTQGNNERIGQIFDLSGKNKENTDQLHAGDIGALVKLKSTHTGDTLTAKGTDFKLPELEFPASLMSFAVEPKSKGDEGKISTGFQSLHEEDPTFLVQFDPELKQTIISGQGELHLDIKVKRLKQKFGVEVNMKDPRIPYRETIKSPADAKYRHKKQSGGAGQFAEVWMRIEPKPRGEGVEFTNSLVGQNVDRVYVPSVEKGVNAACEEG